MVKSKQKIALITGTGGELGAQIASALSEDGMYTIGLDMKQEAELTGDGVQAYYQCDLRDLDALRLTLEKIQKQHGVVEVLVNNAAYYRDAPFLSLTVEQIQTTLAVNVTALLYICQLFTQGLITAGRPGTIVNVASIAGRMGSSQVDYGASKAAVINLTQTLGRMLPEHGIRINAVAPALVGSGMGNRLRPGVKERFLESTPLKRAARPEEVASVVRFLASEASSYVNGTTIDIHGGL